VERLRLLNAALASRSIRDGGIEEGFQAFRLGSKDSQSAFISRDGFNRFSIAFGGVFALLSRHGDPSRFVGVYVYVSGLPFWL
jgi:hypothetical protein